MLWFTARVFQKINQIYWEDSNNNMGSNNFFIPAYLSNLEKGYCC